MKRFLICILCFTTYFFYGQQNAADFVADGVQLHDKGDYKGALAQYEKALAIDKNNPGALYEMAVTYSKIKEYTKSIENADKIIKADGPLTGKGYLIKGISLDYSGKSKEAISTFKKGIKKAPEFNSLYYALAITTYNLKEYGETEKALQGSLKVNPLHGNSHYLLGTLVADERTKSMLAYFNFLITEPTGQRANKTYNELLKQQKLGVTFEDDKNISVKISYNKDNDFNVAEMMLSMMEASKTSDENKGKSDFTLFSENTKSLFRLLGELKTKDKMKGFWWDYYVDFFSALANNDAMYETFTYYISQDINSVAIETWLQENPEKIEAFREWVINYKRKA